LAFVFGANNVSFQDFRDFVTSARALQIGFSLTLNAKSQSRKGAKDLLASASLKVSLRDEQKI